MYEIKPLLKKEADSTLKDMTLPPQRGFALPYSKTTCFFIFRGTYVTRLIFCHIKCQALSKESFVYFAVKGIITNSYLVL